jgi:ATP-dependent DNA helicase DinG
LSSLPEIFSPDGPLAQAISGYRVRGQQLEMAERIAAAINACSVFIAEALARHFNGIRDYVMVRHRELN